MRMSYALSYKFYLCLCKMDCSSLRIMRIIHKKGARKKRILMQSVYASFRMRMPGGEPIRKNPYATLLMGHTDSSKNTFIFTHDYQPISLDVAAKDVLSLAILSTFFANSMYSSLLKEERFFLPLTLE